MGQLDEKEVKLIDNLDEYGRAIYGVYKKDCNDCLLITPDADYAHKTAGAFPIVD